MSNFINIESIDEFACEVQDYWDLNRSYDIDRVKLAAAGSICGSLLKVADENDAAVVVRVRDDDGDMIIRMRGLYLSAQGDERFYLKSAISDADRVTIQIDEVLENEQDALDNYPESLQETDRYIGGERAVELLECAVNSIEEAVDYTEKASLPMA